MSNSSLVLGFFRDAPAAKVALTNLRRERVGCVAAITQTLDGKVSVDDRPLADLGATIFASVGVGVAASLLPLPKTMRPFAIAVGVAVGYGLGRAFDAGVSDKTLSAYKTQVLRGETLLLIEAARDDVDRALELLREDEAATPTTFVVRPDTLPRGARKDGASDALPAELLPPDRLRAYAATIASAHLRALSREKQAERQPLLARLKQNEAIITAVNAGLAEAARQEKAVSLSAEWLLDNAYIIEGQIADVRRNLSRKFYGELPVVTEAIGIAPKNAPRAYALACELIAHTDARLDKHTISEFVEAYQDVAPLSMGELWALPLMLRLALVENLRRLTVQTDRRQRERERADFWANRLLNAAHHDVDRLLPLLSELATEQSAIKPHFADRLVSHLYDEEGALAPVQTWLERKLNASLPEVLAGEQRRQAADQVAVANTITTLRFLSQLDYRETFESLSRTERVLREDAAYPRLDFATRDSYRHEVERIAKGAKKDELEVARHAISDARGEAERAEEASGLPQASGDVTQLSVRPQEHVGYFLIGDGQRRLEEEFPFSPPVARRLQERLLARPLPFYLGGVAGVTALAALGVAVCARRAPLSVRLLLAAKALLPASELGAQFINYLATRVLAPRPLPKMDFESGVPDEFRTLVGVPMLFLSVAAIQEELDALEVRYLANPDANLRFALLSDYTDAPEAVMPQDAALLKAAVDGIDDLNARHGKEDVQPFLLFGRERAWSVGEAAYMGHERKRGKLEELNRYLRGVREVPPTQMHVMAGDNSALDGVKFVITLDADTQLPHGTARQMIETLAHPLNRPHLNSDNVVTRGYAIIQPRVDTALPSATVTRFSRLFTDATGSDPYTHVVSDIYQDAFGEGSYHGKGIYDVEAFDRALSGRFPDNTLLSHDLIEGAHARVGLASDIELLDDFPASYQGYAKRQHRWIRGDFQIAPWFSGRVPAPVRDGSKLVANPLSGLNRWKVFDNLRRSMMPPATLSLLGVGWLLGGPALSVASIFSALVLAAPALQTPLNWIPKLPPSPRVAMRELKLAFARSFANLALLPHQSLIAIDAIARVTYRKSVTHRGLLEWQTAKVASQSATQQKRGFFAQIGAASIFGAGIGVLALVRGGVAGVPFVLPYVGAWLLAPAFVRWLDGGKRVPVTQTVSEEDKVYLRKIGRETWRYFDDFIGPQTNWLPPDNYQEALNVEIAQRTSPTNIGLWMQAITSARDFGWLSVDEVVGRTLSTMEEIGKLQTYRGHLLNWYDLKGQPLRPRYVSTVDSGNLLGSLWCVDGGLREQLSSPVVDESALRGMLDVLNCLQDAARREDFSPLPDEAIAALRQLFDHQAHGPIELIGRLRAAEVPANQLLTGVAAQLPRETKERPATQRQSVNQELDTSDPRFATGATAYWAAKLLEQLDGWISTVDRYARWMELLNTPPDEFLLPLGERGRELRRTLLEQAPSLELLARGQILELNELVSMRRPDLPPPLLGWLEQLEHDAEVARWLAGEIVGQAEEALLRVKQLGDGMEFGFLFDAERKLFSIGFNADESRLDGNDYDLLASECRLASFCTVARGEVPVEHWYALGRRFGVTDGRAQLLSWSGTMFEYLMPIIYLRSYENSLLDEAVRNAVHRQIEYGNSRGVPWGISEAAFSALDANRTYQYKAFGCPGLGLKRGLDEDLVIAPYATAMALPVVPTQAIANLRRLESIGMRGDYGFYESIDFTRNRLDEDNTGRERGEKGERKGAIVRAFMVHHQGMALMALDNLLFDNAMQRRFARNPLVEAATPLLFERVPTAPASLEEAIAPEGRRPRDLRIDTPMASPAERVHQPDTNLPRTFLLGGQDFSLMITNAGGGYTRWRDLDVTRWRADTTRDNWGSFFFLRDLDSNATWGATHQPLKRATRIQNALFKPDKAEFKRRDGDIETFTEVVVSPEDPAEIRRVTLTNHSPKPRRIEVTSYAEVCIAAHAGDRQHPAFQKLFVQTDALPENEYGEVGLLAWRRLRSPKDKPVWAGQLMTGDSVPDATSYETDRSRFIGRARSLENPIALEGELSNTHGAVLDPVFALRRCVTIQPGERVTMAFITVAGESRDDVTRLLDKYRDMGVVGRAFDLAWTHAQLELHHLRLKGDETQRFQQLAAHLIYPSSPLRAPMKRLRENAKGQAGLWAYGVSGDLPILLVTIDNARDLPVVRQALAAHTYWRVRGLKCDLVVLNEQASSYDQGLTESLRKLIAANTPYTGVDQNGGVFLRALDQIPREDLTLLLTCARVHLVAARGGLAQQLADATLDLPQGERLRIASRPPEEVSATLPFMELPFFNGTGGFTSDGREYAIYLGPGKTTPAPWSNVMANPHFGAMVTENGQGYAWQGNSQSNKLTPWSNDPTTDAASEAIYIRDEDSGVYWTPTPLPIRENDAYRARHGQGYTVWEHNSHAIEQELTTFVPTGKVEAPVRVQRLKLRNRSSRRRRLTVTFFCEWVLGTTKEETQMHVVSTWDAQGRILFARNAYNPDYGHKTAWVSASPAPRNFNADRTVFMGRNGSPATPAAMRRKQLLDRVGAGLDPCGAIQVEVSIEPNQETEVTFLLGQTDNVDQARAIVSRYRQPANVQNALAATGDFWDETLSAISVEVPDLAVNFLLNRWLVYQVLSCRVWGRSAFYQSGGAFGFRDQLQDVCALLYSRPEEARAHILRASAHQFEEGDVQHWWHEPSGAGVRTKFSDDLLWLPFVVAQYVRVTGDTSVLEEEVGFLSAPELSAEEHEKYFQPGVSPQKATVYEHCRRSLERGCTRGAHDLPLIGIGDWNDGFSAVGEQGKGESVWLAWFLVETLNTFADVSGGVAASLSLEVLDAASANGTSTQDPNPTTEDRRSYANVCRQRARDYGHAVEHNAWDGDWYRRAYYDNGAPLGSKESDEAKIDAIAQAWSVLCGAGDSQRSERAMQSVEKHLIKPDLGIILLFEPPFDKTTQNPGYIKGYLPGVRENGGQYTHAAVWTAMAFARKGSGNRAVELLRMLNPVEHARTETEVERYKVEPYVVCADIYNMPGQYGRGGWTWYTGSASWMYRVWIEEVLGFTKRGHELTLNPCVPQRWRQFSMRYRFGSTRYEIVFQNPDGVECGVVSVELDENLLSDGVIHLEDDGAMHHIRVRMGTGKRTVDANATAPETEQKAESNGHGDAVAALPAPVVQNPTTGE